MTLASQYQFADSDRTARAAYLDHLGRLNPASAQFRERCADALRMAVRWEQAQHWDLAEVSLAYAEAWGGVRHLESAREIDRAVEVVHRLRLKASRR